MTLPVASMERARQNAPEVSLEQSAAEEAARYAEMAVLMLRDALAGARDETLTVVTLPAPAGDPLALFRTDLALGATRTPASLWIPEHGPRFVGLGESAVIRLRGEARFAQARTEALTLRRRLRSFAAPGTEAVPPRLVGGFAFGPGAAEIDGWQSFGDGRFVLPRLSYVSASADGSGDASAAQPRFVLCVEGKGDGEEANWVERCAFHLAKSRRGLFASADMAPVVEMAHQSPSAWQSLVQRIRGAIQSGDFEKIVAARRSLARFAQKVDEHVVLERLHAHYPGCVKFALRVPTPEGHATFLGATPERLVSCTGQRVVTEALAGSISVDAEGAEQKLLGSKKDRVEHDLVVRQIVEKLSPLCARLEVADEPRIRRLPQMLHLQTPIEGELRGRMHVLDLVEALHPTPAVGGVPSDAAQRFIERHEPPRGWYSGPVGWLDADGNGEFGVALRSGLIESDRAILYAGAGIVRDSCPDAEYEETGWKLQALLGALGA